jgi:hypothetical protein
MEPTNPDSTRKLLLWSVPIVLGHFVAVIWHLFLLVKVQPGTPRFFPPLLILFNLFPVAGLVALAKGLRKLAGSLIILPLAIALVIGTYAHFLSPGIAHSSGIPDTFFPDQCRVARASRGAGLLGWDSHIRAFIGATWVEYLKENGVVRLNWC